MLITKGQAIHRHKTTGRELNKWRDSVQSLPLDIYTNKEFLKHYSALKFAITYTLEYKIKHPNKTNKRLELLERVLAWLIIYNKRLLQVKICGLRVNYNLLKKVAEDLENDGLCIIYQGYSTREGGARPMAIKATDKLLNLAKEKA